MEVSISHLVKYEKKGSVKRVRKESKEKKKSVPLQVESVGVRLQITQI